MAYRRGFTIVEIAVVLVIMTILLVLGVASYTSSQGNARDKERQADAENITRALERFYTNGYDDTADSTSPRMYRGSYPTISSAAKSNFLTTYLADLDDASRQFSFGTMNFRIDDPGATTQVDVPADQTRIGNATGTNTITYQPMAWDSVNNYWITCRGQMECRRFKLYYRTEKGSVLKTIESTNQ